MERKEPKRERNLFRLPNIWVESSLIHQPRLLSTFPPVHLPTLGNPLCAPRPASLVRLIDRISIFVRISSLTRESFTPKNLERRLITLVPSTSHSLLSSVIGTNDLWLPHEKLSRLFHVLPIISQPIVRKILAHWLLTCSWIPRYVQLSYPMRWRTMFWRR